MAKKPTPDPMAVSMPDIGKVALDPQKATATKGVEGQLVELAEKVVKLTSEVEAGAAREARLSTLVEQSLGGTGAVAPIASAAVTKPEPLPDPIDDKEGFQKALLGMIGSAVTNAVTGAQAATSAATAHQGRYEKLWEDFQTVHAEEGKHPHLVKAIGIEKVNELTARGLDADKVIFGNPKGFMADVASAVAAEVKSIKGDEEGDAEPSGEPKAGITPGSLPADNRDVVPTGGGTPASEGGPAAEVTGAFVNEVKDLQKEAGFI